MIDTYTNTIYRVPEWMIPTIIEKIEYEEMTKDWEKTYTFTEEQQETLRIMEQSLYIQNIPNNIEEQRLEKKLPKAKTYNELMDEFLPLIDKTTLQQLKKRLLPIYNLRNEQLPELLNTIS